MASARRSAFPFGLLPRRGAAVNLVLAVARLRADGYLLVKDVNRALKRATIPDADLKRLRRLADGFAWTVARTHRYCLPGASFGSAGANARHLARALKVLRNRAPYYVLVRDADQTEAKGFVQLLLYRIALALDEIRVDLSDADLSGLGVVEDDVLADVVWTSDTLFPPGMAEELRGRSDKLTTGVFRVRNNLPGVVGALRDF